MQNPCCDLEPQIKRLLYIYISMELANILTWHSNYGGRSGDVKERQANTGLSTLIFIISKSEGSEHLHWRAQSSWQFLHHCIHVGLIIICWLHITIAYQSNVNHQPLLQKTPVGNLPQTAVKNAWTSHTVTRSPTKNCFGFPFLLGSELDFPSQYYLICDQKKWPSRDLTDINQSPSGDPTVISFVSYRF